MREMILAMRIYNLTIKAIAKIPYEEAPLILLKKEHFHLK